jgi:hypothetical protein
MILSGDARNGRGAWGGSNSSRCFDVDEFNVAPQSHASMMRLHQRAIEGRGGAAERRAGGAGSPSFTEDDSASALAGELRHSQAESVEFRVSPVEALAQRCVLALVALAKRCILAFEAGNVAA